MKTLKQLSRWWALASLASVVMAAGCTPGQEVRGNRILSEASGESRAEDGEGGERAYGGAAKSGGGPNWGFEVGPRDGSIGNTTDQIIYRGKQELRHIVDPFDGSYKTKVTIPKNYSGMLYLSGINITSLADKHISVRFRFGREREEVIVPAVIGRAPGITPSTDIQVLILDLEKRPFEKLRLFYDLFDYTDYDSNGNQMEFDATDKPKVPEDDPLAAGLYCRGLRLEDDPTFDLSSANGRCEDAGERCLYAYAKIADSGLYEVSGTEVAAINPSRPALDFGKRGYAQQAEGDLLKQCLPDTNHRASNQTSLQTQFTGANAQILGYGHRAFQGDYEYRGPYRALNRSQWEIEGQAIFSAVAAGEGARGLFQYQLDNSPVSTAGNPNAEAEGGLKSFLFPRAGTMELKGQVEYLGFSHLPDPLGLNNSAAVRSIKRTLASGTSDFVDGCNLRVSQRDPDSLEGISSCTVAASIDLVYDDDQGVRRTLTSSKEIKLQLVRPSLKNVRDNEILYTALKNCANGQACAAGECCFNGRCWSKDLVSQCLEDEPLQGNLPVGSSCASDLECSSLCCSARARVCSVHRPEDGVWCSKPVGQACVTKNFCSREYVPTCFVVETGTSVRGKRTCALRCYHVPTLGECQNGVCRPPAISRVPNFDPAEEGACEEAIPPPTQFDDL